jgi:hypothetical protein
VEAEEQEEEECTYGLPFDFFDKASFSSSLNKV